MKTIQGSRYLLRLVLVVLVFTVLSLERVDRDPASSTDLTGILQPISINLSGSDFVSLKNPSAVYCRELGYEFRIIKQKDGGEDGICLLPGETACPSWDFLNGRCGQEYSYCAQQGWGIQNITIDGDSDSPGVAVCVDVRGYPVGSVYDLIDLIKKSTGHEASEPIAELLGPPDPPVQNQTPNLVPPVSFDWRNYSGSDWVTPVKNQGVCGSCWSFSAVGVAESIFNIAASNPDLDLDFSEQYLVTDCLLYHDCNGGNKGTALYYIRDNGIPDEGCLPYQDGISTGCTYNSSGCCSSSNSSNCGSALCTYASSSECSDCRCSDRCGDWSSRLYTIDSAIYMGYNPNKDVIKQALIDHGPLAVSMYYEGPYTGGTYTCSNAVNNGTSTNHAVVLVGYNDAGSYWIVKNSWGTGWGPVAISTWFTTIATYRNIPIMRTPPRLGTLSLPLRV
jgi:putative hemolysin